MFAYTIVIQTQITGKHLFLYNTLISGNLLNTKQYILLLIDSVFIALTAAL